MNEQIIILFFLVVGTATTLYLYVWKAKKEMEYKKDERWQLIQLKANNTANISNYILILLIAAGDSILLFSKIEISISLNRVLTYCILFIALRNAIEFFALKYFDKQL